MSGEKRFIIVIDAGTTVHRIGIFDAEQGLVAVEKQTHAYLDSPEGGKIENDPLSVWGSISGLVQTAITRHIDSLDNILALAVTNQRESIVMWDKNTGAPLYNAILWLDKRGKDLCMDISEDTETKNYIKHTTGLEVDPVFSASKIRWILDNVPGARQACEEGRVMLGTMDTWLLWNLTGRKLHLTDYTNASRTMLFDIKKLQWDAKLLRIFGIPPSILPEARPSCEVYGTTDPSLFFNLEIPIACIIADQQAALFGHQCFAYGDTKNSYSAGSFVMTNIGKNPVISDNGLITTIAWAIKHEITYAFEGPIFFTGAIIQWLADEFRILRTPNDTEYYANSIPDSDGVFMIPAFTGLGAPYWKPDARGGILGISTNTTFKHIIRASLESIGYRTRDVIDAMEISINKKISSIKIDGGAAENNFLLQFQSDILGMPVIRPRETQTTIVGAGLIAAIAMGKIKNIENINRKYEIEQTFSPKISAETREKLYTSWLGALKNAICPFVKH